MSSAMQNYLYTLLLILPQTIVCDRYAQSDPTRAPTASGGDHPHRAVVTCFSH